MNNVENVVRENYMGFMDDIIDNRLEAAEAFQKAAKEKGNIYLDIGCGSDKQEYFIGMDKRALDNVDVVWDIEIMPWPLPDDTVDLIICSHLIEHIKPWLTINFFDECWRILKPEGVLALSTPYAGSDAYWQDPTHCNGFNHVTFLYFEPLNPLYKIYRPKPWKIRKGYPAYARGGNLEILMRKLEDKGDNYTYYMEGKVKEKLEEMEKGKRLPIQL